MKKRRRLARGGRELHPLLSLMWRWGRAFSQQECGRPKGRGISDGRCRRGRSQTSLQGECVWLGRGGLRGARGAGGWVSSPRGPRRGVLGGGLVGLLDGDAGGLLFVRLMRKLRKNHKVVDGAAEMRALQGAPEGVDHLNLRRRGGASGGGRRHTGYTTAQQTSPLGRG